MSIYDFLDYRVFLRAYIERAPRGEINRLASHMGVHASLVSQVLGNTKNLSLEQGLLACERLGLTEQETEFFLLMVQYQRAGSEKLRQRFHRELERMKKTSHELTQNIRQDRELSDEEKAIFYSHWLYVAVWLSSSLEGGRSLEEIVEFVRYPRDRVVDILQFLVANHLCSLADGVYKMGSQSVHLERGSSHLPRHHGSWRLKAIEHADRITAEELMYTAPMSLSEPDFAKLRKRLIEVIKEVTDTAIRSNAEKVACFNLDFFFLRP